MPQLLSSYLQYHSIEGSTADTIKHKKKELGLFVRHLSDQGYSMLPEHLTFFDAVGHLDYMMGQESVPGECQYSLQCY